MRKPDTPRLSYELVEKLLSDDAVCQRYDETKMHWLGDPDPAQRAEGRYPWIKRQHGEIEHVYSLPVLAAFSIAEAGLKRQRQHGHRAEVSLVSIRKDPWHDDDNPAAWFVGRQNLMTGEVIEPEVLSASVDAGHLLWLQALAPSSGARYSELTRLPRDQRRYSTRLDANYRAQNGEYRAGLRLPPERLTDIVALESMMRLVCQARDLELPRTVNAAQLSDSRSEYRPAA